MKTAITSDLCSNIPCLCNMCVRFLRAFLEDNVSNPLIEYWMDIRGCENIVLFIMVSLRTAHANARSLRLKASTLKLFQLIYHTIHMLRNLNLFRSNNNEEPSRIIVVRFSLVFVFGMDQYILKEILYVIHSLLVGHLATLIIHGKNRSENDISIRYNSKNFFPT